jgi:Leucine-rich repeat (LRR) protein
LIETLPDSIGQWTSLTHFVVYGNLLSGTLPNSIGQWTALIYCYFDVLSNNFNGTIPSSIGNWSLIELADFSENQFVGTCPNPFASILIHILILFL